MPLLASGEAFNYDRGESVTPARMVSSVSFYAILNRRHKSAIFLVLIAAGITLAADHSLSEGLGVILIGIAFAWAIGSDYRPVHEALLLCGIILAFAPIVFDWNRRQSEIASYQKSVASFESNISFFAKLYPKKKINPGEIDMSAGLFPIGMSDDQRRALVNSPWVREAEDAGIDWRDVPRDQKPSLLEPPVFGLKSALSDNWRSTVPGMLLACLGLGLVVGVNPKSHPDSGQG